ncbi:ankyrin repeat domain-containing protein [Nonomuraea sp. NPDC050663]|uniref:ankyrin repeat domain-containing protein n=1 Tax=Nonomuraea sp. NPDC050663 TaxID=3364370 RepID=UPI00379651F0
MTGWIPFPGHDWKDAAKVRARLAAGADPNAEIRHRRPPLHMAARHGSPEAIGELVAAGAVAEAVHRGRTALWEAVFANRPDNARALVAAGADPWRPMMAGWSPGRLSLAGREPGLFGEPPGGVALSPDERAAVDEARRLIAVFGGFDFYGRSLACAAGLSARDVARRLGAEVAEEERVEELREDPWAGDGDELSIVGVTEVQGGCVVTQPWAYGASTPGVGRRLSAGTICHTAYSNPKSGHQWREYLDGEYVASDGVRLDETTSADWILWEFLYFVQPVAFGCARAGLRPTDDRAIAGEPDVWLRLPDLDWWA